VELERVADGPVGTARQGVFQLSAGFDAPHEAELFAVGIVEPFGGDGRRHRRRARRELRAEVVAEGVLHGRDGLAAAGIHFSLRSRSTSFATATALGENALPFATR